MPDKGYAMQVDRYNHLLFPRDANAGGSRSPADAAGQESPSSASAGTARNGAVARALPAGRGAQQADATQDTVRPEGVVLKIQWPDGPGSAKPVDPPLYTPGRRMPVTRDATETAAAATVDAGSTAPVAEQREQPQPDFVALAVSALREYRDDRERQQVVSSPAASPAPEAHWSALKGLQQFAAKLNVFA